MKKFFLSILIFLGFMGLIGLAYLYSPWWPFPSTQSKSNATVRDIPVLEGFIRMENSAFAIYLLDLPLADEGQRVRLFNGEIPGSIQKYNFRVVDKPILSHSEQCADVCMHLRADFLYTHRHFFDIHFEDTQQHTLRYWWGNRPWKFYSFLCNVFEVANTESMMHEMPVRSMSEIQPGDVFVYDYKSRPNAKYGHAMMVLSVAENPQTGQKAIMLVQGSTPACSIHVLKNQVTGMSWFVLDEKVKNFDFGFAKYKADELRFFP